MIMKKIVAALSVISMISASSAAFAATSYKDATATATASVDKIAAGEVITIDYSYDTLVDANGGTVVFYYDAAAFSPVEGTQSIKVGKKNYDFDNYVSQTALDAIGEETHILYNMFGTFEWAITEDYKGDGTIEQDCVAAVNADAVDVIKFVYGDSSYAVTADDEAEDMYPVNTVGINLVANADIQPGTYTIVASSLANNKTSEITDYPVKTFTVTVEGAEPPAKAELVEEDEEKGKGALETKEDGKKYYTQGFMATLTLNGQTVNAVNFKLKNKDVTIDSADNDKNVEGWSAPFEGEAPFVFAINVINVPDGETVTCDWYME